MTTNVYYGMPDGLKFVPGTYHAFGNKGSTPYFGSVNSGSNTALNNDLATNGPAFISAAQLYIDLTNASDHLPVVADYTIPVPSLMITSFNLAGPDLVFTIANCVTGGIYTVLTTTNLSFPPTRWTALATNVAASGSFNLTATNAAVPSAPERFYLLQQQ